jgi:hypothetical protein
VKSRLSHALVLLALFLPLHAGCKTFFHLDPRLSVRDFYPLAIGNRWVYEDSSGTEQEEILADHIGEFFYNPNTRLGIAYDDQGVIEARFNKGVPGARWYIIKTPLTIGAIWSSQDLLYEVTETRKTIRVRAGTFRNCLEVRVRHKREFVTSREPGTVETVITLTFAPNVGLVELKTTQGSRLIYKKELLSYQRS